MSLPPNHVATFTGFLLGLLATVLMGCFTRPVAPVLSPAYVEQPAARTPAPASTRERAAVEGAQQEVDRLRGELKTAESKLGAKEKALREKDMAILRSLGLWMAGLAFIGAAGATAAAVFLPVFRARLAMGAVACLAVMVLALTVNAFITWLPVIGTVIFAIGLAAMIGWLIKSRQAITEAAAAGDVLERTPVSQARLVKRVLLEKQIDKGVDRLIADARGKPLKTLKDLL